MARIGIVTYDFYPLIGGIGRHTFQMFSSLRDADLLFFSPAINSLPRHILIDFLPIRFLKQLGVSLWLHFNASRIIAEHRLDKLNIHTGPGGVLCVRSLPVPVIITCHHTYRQQLDHLRFQFWKRVFLPFEKSTYRRATRIVCVSDATRHALINYYKIPEDKIITVYNAVDTNQFHPMGMAKKPHTIVYLGRIDKRKGIDFLIRSMPQVSRKIPNALLLVGGKGPLLEEMKLLVSRLKLERNVSFLGFVPDDHLNSLYNKAQCVVVPSIFEGFGITVIEAIAAGTRVVGTASDGIREILKNTEYGRLVPFGDTGALAEAIIAELINPQQADALQPEYRIDHFVERYREVLRSCKTISRTNLRSW